MENPSQKYGRPPVVPLRDRQWPTRVITKAPVWLSTDLRDGNQALLNPMDIARKRGLFDLLVRLGFKQIEIGFPAASATEFEFVRHLIESHAIPDDVTVMVMTPSREDLMQRTFEAMKGARRVIVSLFNATAPLWRKLVFGMSTPEMLQWIDRNVRLFRDMVEEHPDTEWALQYSPECFSMTELDVAVDACNTAIHAWGASASRPLIVNLPATIEVSTPNVFADQVEWMHCHLDRRDCITLSVHPHNDRGTATAAAELALMAGAERVEGCLFGNGERAGNLDLVTLALNLYAHGVDPGLDFSDLNEVARVAESCTQIPIHPRHPYAGDLVHTAFAGSHQDAIRKGFAARGAGERWEVPYLAIDPADVGKTYASVIRVNSQSGKGGVGYLLERDFGVKMPRRMEIEFSAVVQRRADASGTEISSEELWDMFRSTYLAATQPIQCQVQPVERFDDEIVVRFEIRAASGSHQFVGRGANLAAAVIAAIGTDLRVDSLHVQNRVDALKGQALAVLESAEGGRSHFCLGLGPDASTAVVRAILSAAGGKGNAGVSSSLVGLA